MSKLIVIFFLLLISLGVKPVFATVSCTTQYGGGQTCIATGQLLVNKKVWNPETKQFVDNLTASDHRFQSGDEVVFSVDIKNVGDVALNNIQFTDTLPSFLVWSGGDPLTSIISSLTPGQMVTKTIRAKVVTGVSSICQMNTAVASVNGMTDRDTAQVCFIGAVPKVIPKAGPEYLLLLLPLSGIGFLMRGVKK